VGLPYPSSPAALLAAPVSGRTFWRLYQGPLTGTLPQPLFDPVPPVALRFSPATAGCPRRIPPRVNARTFFCALGVSGHPLLTPPRLTFALPCFPRRVFARAFPPRALALLAPPARNARTRTACGFSRLVRPPPPTRSSWGHPVFLGSGVRARCPPLNALLAAPWPTIYDGLPTVPIGGSPSEASAAGLNPRYGF